MKNNKYLTNKKCDNSKLWKGNKSVFIFNKITPNNNKSPDIQTEKIKTKYNKPF